MANEFPEATARDDEEVGGPGSAGHDLAMNQDEESDRFQITWHGFHYGYRVSIPNYEGGEVVRAEVYDAAIEALKGVAIMLNTGLSKYEDEPWAQRVRAALHPHDF